MNEEFVTLHTKAARACGKDKSCGDKFKHSSYATALKHANSLSISKNKRHDVEPYFCSFCWCWHVGRVFSLKELKTFSLIADMIDDGLVKVKGEMVDLSLFLL